MRLLKVCVGILLIFIMGMLAGTLGTGFFIKHRIGRFIQGGGPPPPIRILERLSAKLDLSKPQQREIEKILKQAHDNIYEAIDLAADKAERRLRRLKEKRESRRRSAVRPG